MRKFIMAVAACACMAAGAVTATKEWVQTATSATLAAAKAYTDAHGGGITTNEVKALVNAETGGTNTITHGGPYLATAFTNAPSFKGPVTIFPNHDEAFGLAKLTLRASGEVDALGAQIEMEGAYGSGASIIMRDSGIEYSEKAEVTIGTMPVRATISSLPTYSAVTNAAGAVATNVYAAMPTTYAATNAVVALNQSVQYAVANGTEIAITPPSAVADGIRDWVLYLNGTAETALDLSAFSGLLAADAAYTNAVASNVVTVLYFSEITNGVFHLSRQELTPVK